MATRLILYCSPKLRTINGGCETISDCFVLPSKGETHVI